MKVQATKVDAALIIVAGGSGARFGSRKQFVEVFGKPLVAYAAEAFSALEFSERILVLPSDVVGTAAASDLLKQSEYLSNFKIVAGGSTRALSVRAGLEAIATKTEYAFIHDGARPFPPVPESMEALRLLQSSPANLGAVIVAAPVTDCLKRVGTGAHSIDCTVPREEYIRAETPQVVRIPALLSAMNLLGAESARDEAEVIELAGGATAFVLHHGFNPKVTHPADLSLVESSIQRKIGTLS